MTTIQHHHWPGCSTVSPYLMTDRAHEVIAFATAVFDAEPVEAPLLRADGSVLHATLKIGDTSIMVGDPRDQTRTQPAVLHVYVPDCDATVRRAVAAGARVSAEPADHGYGDRGGAVVDPAGNTWWIATHMRTLPRAELERLARDADGDG